MAVAPRGLTVCGPSCVCNTSVRVKDLGQVWLFLVDELLEFGNLPNLFVCKHLVLFVPIDSKASRVLRGRLAGLEAILFSIWGKKAPINADGMVMDWCKRNQKSMGQLTYPLYSSRDKPLTRVSRMYLRSFSTR